jgi:hypothetical protein
LRALALASVEALDEKIKWGHLVYFSNGPAFLIRAEDHRVLFGFWRGKRLRAIEPRLKPGGKFEMATLVLDATTTIAPQDRARARRGSRGAQSQARRSHEGIDMIKTVGRTPIRDKHRLMCHCGDVVLELDLPDGIVDARRCNCSMCRGVAPS